MCSSDLMKDGKPAVYHLLRGSARRAAISETNRPVQNESAWDLVDVTKEVMTSIKDDPVSAVILPDDPKDNVSAWNATNIATMESVAASN